jgi:RNA polymerase sigma factor (sigma-70 family)
LTNATVHLTLGEVTLEPAGRALLGASDELLIRACADGDERGFEVLHARYRPGMLALCTRLLGSREEAEDAVQHAFAAAWRHCEQGVIPEHPKAWLYAIARNRCVDVLAARRPVTVGAALEAVPAPVSLGEDVLTRAEAHAVLADIGDLPPEQRTALVLAELGGLSHLEIAGVLGRREGSIRGLVHEARRTLVDWRAAREASCRAVREQLETLRGGALRHRRLRRHLQTCSECRAHATLIQSRRRSYRLVLPGLPGLRGVVALFGAGGGVATVGGVATLGCVACLVAAGPAHHPGLRAHAAGLRDGARPAPAPAVQQARPASPAAAILAAVARPAPRVASQPPVPLDSHPSPAPAPHRPAHHAPPAATPVAAPTAAAVAAELPTPTPTPTPASTPSAAPEVKAEKTPEPKPTPKPKPTEEPKSEKTPKPEPTPKPRPTEEPKAEKTPEPKPTPAPKPEKDDEHKG